MDSRAFILLALVVLLGLSANAYKPPIPPPVCYTRKQVCCYKYSVCGVHLHRRKFSYPCPYRKCIRKCIRKCYPKCVVKRVKKLICRTKFRVIKKCHYGKCRWIKVRYTHCVWVWVPKRHCYPYCYKHCYKYCFTVKATCSVIKVFKRFRFCPKHWCGKPHIHGSSAYPGNKFSKKFLVKTIPLPRVTHH